MTGKLEVRQVVGTSNRPHQQAAIIKGLGLRGPGTVVVVANTPSFRGMIKKVMHLVKVQEIKS